MPLFPTRRAAMFGAAGIPCAVRAVSATDNWLLTDRVEIEAARSKAEELSLG